MKTLIIYSDFCDLPTFAIIDGDYSRLNNQVIGSGIDDILEQELLNLIFNKDGLFNIDFLKDIPKLNENLIVINVGFSTLNP